MSSLISLSIDVTKITKSKIKDGKYLEVTISVDDQTNQWGKNASIYESQTKEERESKASKTYIGGGKVVQPRSYRSNKPRHWHRGPPPVSMCRFSALLFYIYYLYYLYFFL